MISVNRFSRVALFCALLLPTLPLMAAQHEGMAMDGQQAPAISRYTLHGEVVSWRQDVSCSPIRPLRP